LRLVPPTANAVIRLIGLSYLSRTAGEQGKLLPDPAVCPYR
jgi:hypothetical protein